MSRDLEKTGEAYVDLIWNIEKFGCRYSREKPSLPDSEETYKAAMEFIAEIDEYCDPVNVEKREKEFQEMLEDYRKNGPDHCPCGLPPSYCKEICGMG